MARFLLILLLGLVWGGIAVAEPTKSKKAQAKEPPKPQIRTLCRQERDCRLTLIASLQQAPFPYRGKVGDSSTPFYDHRDPSTGQRQHSVGPDLAYPESPHYSDNRVLIHVPPQFRPGQSFELLVFFHGHGSELERTLIGEMNLPGQINASRRNLILIAPQLARDARDSSPGKLFRRDALRRLLDETSRLLANQLGGKVSRARLAGAPLLLTAYSGGYRALAYSLERGGVGAQIKGVLLLDALYGELDKIQAWLARSTPSRLLVNLYGETTTELSEALIEAARRRGRKVTRDLPKRLRAGQIYAVAIATPHERIVQEGPPQAPLAEFLRRLPR